MECGGTAQRRHRFATDASSIPTFYSETRVKIAKRRGRLSPFPPTRRAKAPLRRDGGPPHSIEAVLWTLGIVRKWNQTISRGIQLRAQQTPHSVLFLQRL